MQVPISVRQNLSSSLLVLKQHIRYKLAVYLRLNVFKGGVAFLLPFVKMRFHGPSCNAEGPGVHAEPLGLKLNLCCLQMAQPYSRFDSVWRGPPFSRFRTAEAPGVHVG